MIAYSGHDENSYIAIDEFAFINTDQCKTSPAEAIPDDATTQAPTEPPDGMKVQGVPLTTVFFQRHTAHYLMRFEPN